MNTIKTRLNFLTIFREFLNQLDRMKRLERMNRRAKCTCPVKGAKRKKK